MGIYRKFGKRFFDITLSLLLIITLTPVLIIVSILVAIKLGKPVFFKQQRPGLNEKVFTLIKFRTMTSETDFEGNLLSDDIRLTKFGKMLRSTSLDELPELFNILKGDMSFVGPRPLLVSYLPLYNEEQKTRHDVRPGLTGLAQVKGRNSLSWEDKFEFDLQYIEHLSMLKDFIILLQTFIIVFKKEGISSPAYITNTKFNGSEK